MRLDVLKSALFTVALALLVGATIYAQGQAQGQGQGQAQGAQAAGRQGGRGGPPQNLQVLPKDMTTQQVTQLMRTFTAALGVECSHCHVGTMADRAKDDNPKKGVARKMMQMTASINDTMLKGIGDAPAAGVSKVTCFTCHRGAIKPLTAPAPGGGN